MIDFLKKDGEGKIQEGLHYFHPDFAPYNETKYISSFLDIKDAIAKKEFKSGYEHFCLFGFQEIIQGIRYWPPRVNIEDTYGQAVKLLSLTEKIDQSTISGNIEDYKKGKIQGWIYSSKPTIPLVIVNKIPCVLEQTSIPRADIANKYNLMSDLIGFIAVPMGNIKAISEVSLYSLNANSSRKVISSNYCTINKCKPNSLSMLDKLHSLSMHNDAIAIIIGDLNQTHIERIKSLYHSLISYERPVIIVGFDFDHLKLERWNSIVSNIDIMSVEWNEKEVFKQIIDNYSITFNSIFIYNAILPSFILAEILSNQESKFILNRRKQLFYLSSEDNDLKPSNKLANHLSHLMSNRITAKSYRNIFSNEAELENNYNQFLSLELIASKQKKSTIFKEPLFSNFTSTEVIVPTLILIWKQPDSSLYGRRVDQIARSYKKKYSNHKVIIIETVNKSQLEQYKKEKDYFCSDSPMVLEKIRDKKYGLSIEGIEHYLLYENKLIEKNIRDFFLSNKILPMNSIFIIFPVISSFYSFVTLLDGYKYIVDIVDNQLAWKSPQPEKIIEQYKILTLGAEVIHFNCKNNQQFFYDRGLLEDNQKYKVIKNWYEFPTSFNKLSKKDKHLDKIKIIYSGNMNDRIDWDLIDLFLKNISNDAILYLIGDAKRSIDYINNLLNKYDNCYYLGAIDENTLIDFASTCHFSILPHRIESTSIFMNPIKIHMFAALGLECIAVNVPGLEVNFENLSIANNSQEFINMSLSKIHYIKSLNTDENNTRLRVKKINMINYYKETRDIYIKQISDLLKPKISG